MRIWLTILGRQLGHGCLGECAVLCVLSVCVWSTHIQVHCLFIDVLNRPSYKGFESILIKLKLPLIPGACIFSAPFMSIVCFLLTFNFLSNPGAHHKLCNFTFFFLSLQTFHNFLRLFCCPLLHLLFIGVLVRYFFLSQNIFR